MLQERELSMKMMNAREAEVQRNEDALFLNFTIFVIFQTWGLVTVRRWSWYDLPFWNRSRSSVFKTQNLCNRSSKICKNSHENTLQWSGKKLRFLVVLFQKNCDCFFNDHGLRHCSECRNRIRRPELRWLTSSCQCSGSADPDALRIWILLATSKILKENPRFLLFCDLFMTF